MKFQCPVKSHIHTNPDGSKIEIRSLDIKNRLFWCEEVKDWVLVDKKQRAKKQPEYINISFGSNDEE